MAGIATAITAPGMGSDWTIALPNFGDHGVPIDPTKTATQQPQPAFLPGTPPGDVTVEAGAMISTATGGKAMLFAPHVINAGTISANSGQVIMAAGEQVYLRPLSTYAVWTSPYRLPCPAVSRQLAIQPGQRECPSSLRCPEFDVAGNGAARRRCRLPCREYRRGLVDPWRHHLAGARHRPGGLIVCQYGPQQPGRLCAPASLVAGGVALFHRWRSAARKLESRHADSGESSVIMVEPDLSDISEIEGSSLATRYEPGRVELRGYDIRIKSGASVIALAGEINILASAQPTAPLEPTPATEELPTAAWFMSTTAHT